MIQFVVEHQMSRTFIRTISIYNSEWVYPAYGWTYIELIYKSNYVLIPAS